MTYVSRFTGVCNQCGKCCEYQAPDGSGLVRCGFLIPQTYHGLEVVGVPGSTECSMHALRLDGMPIPMHYVRTGDFYGWRSCALDSPAEDRAIAPHIGRGCSLTVRDA
jgi:hypothetical protein